MSFTNAQLAQKISDLIAYWASFNEEHANWLGGTVAGGPNSDGEYPLTDYTGIETLVKSPAKLQDDVDNITTGATAQANAAAASAAAAAISESNASTSADTATAQAVLADADRVAAELAETNATNAQVTAVAQANLATDRAGYSQEWATTIEDTLVSVAAGGNGTTDYSSLHHAAKASASAAAASTSETNAGTSETNAATSETNADLERQYAAEWANKAENVLVSAAAGGDLVDDYSAFHWAQKAEDFAAAADLLSTANEIITGNWSFDHASGLNIGAGIITAAKITNWDTAYGWGDHSGLYSLAAHNHAGVYEPVNANLIEAGTLTQADNFTYLNRNSANPVLQVAQVGAGDIARFYKTGSLGSTTETSGFTVLNYGAAEVDVASDAWTYRHLRAGVAQGGLYVDTIGQYWLNSAGQTVLKNPVGTKQLVTEDYMTFQQAGGGTAQLLQSTDNESGAGLNCPAIRWWEADGTSVAGMRAYQNPGSTVQSLRLGTGWFSEKLVLSSDDNHELWGKLGFESVDGQFINIKNPNHLKTDSNYNNWIQWRDSADVEVGWIGYGSSADNSMYMRNQCSGEKIELYTSGGDVLCTVGATGALEVQGSSYKTNPTGPRFGQYTSTVGYVQAPANGKIAIWNDNTGEIASFNDDSTTYFRNDIRVHNGGIKTTPTNATWGSDAIHFCPVIPGGARNENASSTTGYIRIKFPGAAGSSWMGGFDLHGYEYNSRGGWGVRISAYEYTNTSWYHESIEILYGSPPFDTCYWGGNSVTNEKYVLLGSSGMTMAYPQLTLSNYTAGYSGQEHHMDADWVVDVSASTPANWVTDTFLRVGGNIRWGDLQSGKNNGGQITINTTSGTPSGGNDGDIHFVY